MPLMIWTFFRVFLALQLPFYYRYGPLTTSHSLVSKTLYTTRTIFAQFT